MNEKRASICGKIKVFKVLTIPNKGALYEYCKHLSPYKEEFYDTLSAIGKLKVQLE